MTFKCAVILLSSFAALANCGLLGQITYADNSIYPGYNDATKVSYSSLSQPSSSSLYSNYQPQQQYQAQPLNYQAETYNQYPSVQQPTYNLQHSSAGLIGQQQYGQLNAHNQYPAAQFVGPRSYSSAGDVSYSFSTGPGYSTSTGRQQQEQSHQHYYANNQQQYGNGQQQYGNGQLSQSVRVQPIQQYSSVPQSSPIQHYSAVHQPQLPQKTIQHFPALPNPALTTNLGTYSPKNAHHYSTFATKTGSAYQSSSVNQHQPTVHYSHSGGAPSTSYRSPNTVFRSSFGTGIPTKPSSEIIPPVLRSPSQPTAPIATVAPLGYNVTPRIIQSTPHFTHTVTSTGGGLYQSPRASSSLAANPIHIPSSPAPVQVQQPQQQPYQSHNNHRYSDSTAVSHATFEGMGVRYQW